jgi:hypothetical protein
MSLNVTQGASPVEACNRAQHPAAPHELRHRGKVGQNSIDEAGPRARWPPESGIADLAVYLTGDGAKTLEQEELDPEMPG